MIGDSQKDKLADGVRSAFVSQPVIVAFLIAFLVAGYWSQSKYNDLQNTINFLLEECITQEHRSR